MPSSFDVSEQPPPFLQAPTWQAFVVEQSMGGGLAHVPPWHVSPLVQGLPSSHAVPSGWPTPAGQAGLVPSQVTGASHWPAAAWQTLVAGSTAQWPSAGAHLSDAARLAVGRGAPAARAVAADPVDAEAARADGRGAARLPVVEALHVAREHLGLHAVGRDRRHVDELGVHDEPVAVAARRDRPAR